MSLLSMRHRVTFIAVCVCVCSRRISDRPISMQTCKLSTRRRQKPPGWEMWFRSEFVSKLSRFRLTHIKAPRVFPSNFLYVFHRANFIIVKIDQQICTLFTVMYLCQYHLYMFRCSSHHHQVAIVIVMFWANVNCHRLAHWIASYM
jgi:hypothetical protein